MLTLFSDSYLFVANLLFCASYLQKELFMLRIFIISAMIFLFYYSIKGSIIFLDSLIFSILFIIINSYSSFKLFKKLFPPNFTTEEKKFYNRYFSKHFTLNEYRKLIDCARRRVYKINTTIINTGNEFTSIFFLADKSSEDIIVDIKVNGQTSRIIDNNSWIGIVEYVDFISNKSSNDITKMDPIFWGIDVCVKFDENSIESISKEENSLFMDDNFSSEIILKKSNNQNEVVFYELDISNLFKLFDDKDDGNSIKNGLHSLWLLYFSEYIYRDSN